MLRVKWYQRPGFKSSELTDNFFRSPLSHMTERDLVMKHAALSLKLKICMMSWSASGRLNLNHIITVKSVLLFETPVLNTGTFTPVSLYSCK